MRRHSLCWILLAGLPLAAPGPWTAAEEPAAAIVLEVKGEAWLVGGPQAPGTVLQPLVWLAPGQTVRTGERGEVTIVTASGRRMILLPKSLAVVQRDGMKAQRGKVTPLGAVQRCPPIADIADGLPSAQAATAAAFVTRGGGCPVITHLASCAAIDFGPEGGKVYDVAVKDGQGRTVYLVQAGKSPVVVPPGVLGRGATYLWEVGLADEEGKRTVAHGVFCTLDSEREEVRQEFLGHVRKSKDTHDLLVLAAYDASAGLLCEACEELGQLEGKGMSRADYLLLTRRLACDCCPSPRVPGGPGDPAP
jgi:hypothetical protein